MFVKTIQKPKNEDAFNRLAAIASAAFISAIILQIISAGTEGVGIYQFLTAVFPSRIMIPIAAFIAIIACVVIELLINAGAYFIGSTLLKWIKGHLGIEVIDVVIFLLVGSVVFFTAKYSIHLSKKNTNIVLRTSAPALPEIVSTESQKDGLTTDMQQLGRKHRIQKTEITTTYSGLIESKKEEFNSQKSLLLNKKQYWIDREQRTGNKYTSKLRSYDQQVLQKETELTAAISKLKKEESDKLDLLRSRVDNDEDNVQLITGQSITTINKVNQDRINLWNEWIEKFSFVFASLAGYSVLIAIILIFITSAIDVKTERSHEIQWISNSFNTSLADDISVWFNLVIVGNIQKVFRRSNNRMLDNRSDDNYHFKYDSDAKGPTIINSNDPTITGVRHFDGTLNMAHFAKLLLSEIQGLKETEQRPKDETTSEKRPTKKRKKKPTKKSASEKECLHCSKVIVGRTARASYCSDACRKDAYDARKKNK